MKLGANHPMGPLQLADFHRLEPVLSIMQVLHDGLADSKVSPLPLLVKYVEAGWLGRSPAAASTTTGGEVPRTGRADLFRSGGRLPCGDPSTSRRRSQRRFDEVLRSSLSHTAGPFIDPEGSPFRREAR